MRIYRFMPFMCLCCVVLLASTGCGSRATGGATVATAGPTEAVIDMPALVIDLGADGVPSIGGLSVIDVAALADLDEATIDSLTLDPNMVAYLTDSNIQHIQVDNSPDGIFILVNGQPIPSLVWDDESLVATAEVMERLGVGVNLLDKVLPLVRNVGVGVILRFPLAADATPIPPVVHSAESAAAASRQAQQQFLKVMGTAPKLRLTVHYDASGAWMVGNSSQAAWEQIAPIPWDALNLPPDIVQVMMEAGIESIGLGTNAAGIFLSVNGEPLPHVAWDHGELRHVLELAKQLQLFDQALSDVPNVDTLISMFEQLLPVVQTTEIDLVVNFP